MEQMDTFFEQIVKKKKSGGEKLLIVGTVLLALVLLALVLVFLQLPMLVALVLMGVGFGAWWVVTSQNKEYEYSVTNGDIDIDLIVAQRQRKRVVSVVGRKLEVLLPYEAGKTPTASFQRKVVAAPSLRESGLWYFTYQSKKNGHTLVVFQPNGRVLRALYGGLQMPVQLDTDRVLREKGMTLGE